ncbi:hypothetical protein GALL_434400 [mine drainage metagenome]|uniref:DUF2905 domain-containing protein n=1 Tax=mine drainage metagenome TaxID=410659 RepID=A0A1J5PTG4_9ZZZZ
MIRWLLVVFLLLIVVNNMTVWLQKLGFGRLPGDLRFKFLGREFFLPLTTSIVLSLVAAGLSRIL